MKYNIGDIVSDDNGRFGIVIKRYREWETYERIFSNYDYSYHWERSPCVGERCLVLTPLIYDSYYSDDVSVSFNLFRRIKMNIANLFKPKKLKLYEKYILDAEGKLKTNSDAWQEFMIKLAEKNGLKAFLEAKEKEEEINSKKK